MFVLHAQCVVPKSGWRRKLELAQLFLLCNRTSQFGATDEETQAEMDEYLPKDFHE